MVPLFQLSDEWSSLVWSTSKQQAKELMNISEAEFIENINQAFTKANKSVAPLDLMSNLMKDVVSTFQPGR